MTSNIEFLYNYRYNKLREFYEDKEKTKLKDKEIRVLMSQDLSDYNGSKVFYGFKDMNKAFEFYKEEEHLYEILYKDIRKLYFDIDKIEYNVEEFEEWLEKFIESINEELKIETVKEDYLIFVNDKETISSCHIISKKYVMHYLKQKKLSEVLIEKYKVLVDGSIYSKNRSFRFVYQSKKSKKILLINYGNEKVKFEEMLINESDGLEELEYEIYEYNKVNKEKALKLSKNYEIKNENIKYVIEEKLVKEILKELDEDYLEVRDLWLKITTVMKYHNLKDIWIEWCKKSKKYNELENENTWNSVSLKMNINWIINILKLEGKEFEYIKSYEEENNDLKIENTIRIDEEYLDEEKLKLKKKLLEKKLIIMKSDTGTAKSTYSSGLIGDKKVISIITTRSLINQHIETFEKSKIELLNYVSDKKLVGNSCVICINSLCKLIDISDEELENTIIFIDEIDSFLFNLTRNKTLDKNLKRIYYLLMRMLNKCHKIIVASSHIKENLKILLDIKVEETIMLKNEKRKHKGIKAHKMNCEENLIERMIKDIKEGKYFLFGCDSKEKTEYVYYRCLEEIKEESKMILITSDSKYEVSDASNKFKNKYVFYSPSVTFGVSFDIEEEQNVYIYGTCMSITPYQIYQQMCRTRQMKEIYYYVKNTTKERKYSSIKEVEDLTEKMVKYSNNLSNMCINEKEDGEIKILKNKYFKLYCWNEYYNDLYMSNVKLYFEKILEDRGFVILNDYNKKKEINVIKVEEIKGKIDKKKEEKVENYIKNESHRDNKEYEDINKRVELLGLKNERKKVLLKYKEVIKDEKEIKYHLNTIKILKTENYLEKKLKELRSETMNVKLSNNSYNKILLLKKMEKDNKISLMDLNFKEDGEVVMEDWVFYLIKKLYGTTKEKPKDKKELRCLYKYMLNHLTGNIIVSEKPDKIKNGKRNRSSNHYLNKNKIIYSLELDKYSNTNQINFEKELLLKFK